MKTYKYIALAALALGFAACTQDDDFTPQQEDIVQIASVNIATEVQTRVNTLGDGKTFENADQILLVNNSRTTNKNSGTYTYNGTNWNLSEGVILYASTGTNDFNAYYPASVDFTLPTDQSTEAGIKSADRMVATTNGVAKGDAVALSFERQNAKITISPIWATEFTGKSISNLLIAEVTPFHPEGATDYSAIITPSETGFTVSVTVDGQSLTATSSTKIEAGNHYTFNLKVGKDVVEITNVSVTKWTEQPISDVETDETLEVSTPEDFETALASGGNIVLMADIALTNNVKVKKNTTIVLNGYTLTPGSLGLGVERGCMLTVTGDGAVNGDEGLWVFAGTLNLQGGTVDWLNVCETSSTANISDGKVIILTVFAGGTANISGGYVGELDYDEGTLIITGGTFGFDPSAYVDTSNYTVTEADGIWTVAPLNN